MIIRCQLQKDVALTGVRCFRCSKFARRRFSTRSLEQRNFLLEGQLRTSLKMKRVGCWKVTRLLFVKKWAVHSLLEQCRSRNLVSASLTYAFSHILGVGSFYVSFSLIGFLLTLMLHRYPHILHYRKPLSPHLPNLHVCHPSHLVISLHYIYHCAYLVTALLSFRDLPASSVYALHSHLFVSSFLFYD